MVSLDFQGVCCSQNEMFQAALLFSFKIKFKCYIYIRGPFSYEDFMITRQQRLFNKCTKWPLWRFVIWAVKEHLTPQRLILFICYLLLWIFFVFLTNKIHCQLNAFQESLNKVASTAGKSKISLCSCRLHTSYYGSHWNLAQTRVGEHVVRSTIMLAPSLFPADKQEVIVLPVASAIQILSLQSAWPILQISRCSNKIWGLL